MEYKKGDLVKVIELIGTDEFWGVELDKTYKVIRAKDNGVYINAKMRDKYLSKFQLEKVKKKKSKKDLRIEELENTIEKILTYLVNK